MKVRSSLRKTITAIALAGALASLGAGAAQAAPMERDHARYCAKVWSDYDYTAKTFVTTYDKYGPNDVLTRQAASNYERAYNTLVNSGC
ncbi:hypothetical protein ONR57_18075 [Hoyosella sp. YIM 151337]|uniref:hypothetical protein n=1 Tax=Hoyosella sp. YIM 151337 TaxID=2992742 RepID=UPI002235A690|nr:hypothetical protein [Hoyosella sp. YIM 151337]MCW4355215.1 hypothetical protein [Hoyosella sp. YIM 151337]